jgi:hypothetical protein
MASEKDEKKVPFLDKTINGDKVTFKLGNGEELVVSKADVSPENWERAALHGISQRLGDACANLSKGKEFGKAYEIMNELKAQLGQKEWSKGREGTSKQLIEDLITALAKIKKLDEEIVRAAVDKADEAKRKQWLSNKAVNAEILEIRAKRAKKDKGNATADDVDLGLEEV